MVDAVRPHWNHGVLPHIVTQVCSLKLQEINDLSAALRQAEVKSLNATMLQGLPPFQGPVLTDIFPYSSVQGPAGMSR